MLSEEDFKKRFKHKLMSFVNDWFFNKERGDKVIQDNYDIYLTSNGFRTPEELAELEFTGWSKRGDLE